MSVASHLLQSIMGKKEQKMNIGKAGQASLILVKCSVTIQNRKQIRNVVLWFCRLSFPHALPSMLPRLAWPLMSRPWVCPVAFPARLTHSSPPARLLFLESCSAWWDFKGKPRSPSLTITTQLGKSVQSCASRPLPTNRQTDHPYMLMIECVCVWCPS